MGAWQEIVDYTVPSNTTSVVLDDFGTITKDDFVKVVCFFNNNVSDSVIGLYANAELTIGNYHTQTLLGSNTTVEASRTTTNRFVDNGGSSVFAYLKLSENNRLNIWTYWNKRMTSTLLNAFGVVTSSGATFTSGITSFTFRSDTASDRIGSGSRIQIYKLAAEKVADITVASNTTQVDISNLSIHKDSEYLLVSEVINATAGFTVASLMVNDATTASSYHRQRIRAIESTAQAFRNNTAEYVEFGENEKSLVYSHIKLSNIGAYTSQNYQIRNHGTSTVHLANSFTSSTSEAITSITKLNIVSTTNSIAAGSRFTLYKLYE